MGIKHEDWYGPEARGLHWGVHDDLSFQILGDLLVNKTAKQKECMAQGKPKEPLFLTHYTISSHGPYRERPKWYADTEKPNFSALCSNADEPKLRQDYLEMRYFTDVELGKFMDRMASNGILNDTIVVIVGDHGTGYGVSATRVAGAIIAEGRLGDDVGLVIDDATEHYDILNTLADIAGVPDGGGRSLKRNVTFGERAVFSNDPNKKMSIVRGHQRLRYDRISDAVFLHNADTDHHETTDLFPELTEEERAEWMAWRGVGRRINTYYTSRWDDKCLFAISC
ncbi:sulfatase-like protein [Phytophthora cinnamomi]|uniref:sulfatase-like protein n=1 Tax=Phytophthora cinnamomi TaxID=4785 RepID=UPI0035598458|nr:sulfatase-like protein [Phytophthora cinnamomi]